MADNYLERKMEEYQARKHAPTAQKSSSNPSLDSLILRNRSVRGYDRDVPVTEAQLMEILSVCPNLMTGKNRQILRYVPVTEPLASKITPLCGFGGLFPGNPLPYEGTEPTAYIIICTILPEDDRNQWIDLGIAAQSILLKATSMGLSGLMIMSFKREEAAAVLDLAPDTLTGVAPRPIMAISLGRSAEKIQLLHHEAGVPLAKGDLHYFRKEGIHYVPKIQLSDLLCRRNEAKNEDF